MTAASPVSYELAGSIATIAMDDGKANVMSLQMLQALHAALDRAQRDRALVLLVGRERRFSGGYDLAVFQRSPAETLQMLRAGAEFCERLLGFPQPVVAACNGHAVAQGAFMLLAADVRIGTAGPYKIGLNEVAIGLTVPYYGIELARFRLTPPWFNHALLTGTLYGPDEAKLAGFLDMVVQESELLARAREEAQRLAKLDMPSHAAIKQRARGEALAKIHDGIVRELHAV